MLKATDQELTKARLANAMERRHPVTVTYTKADGEVTVRTIEIFELKQSKAGDFYVRAMDRKTGEARSFRIDRMLWITIHRTGFQVKRPTNLKAVVMAKDSGAPVQAEADVRKEIVQDWYAVKALADACDDARRQAPAQTNLSMALRPLRLMLLMAVDGDSYRRAAESARKSVAQARKALND